jgi:hypothetical protein
MINPYSTQYTSLQELLSGAGYDMGALRDPGSLYGFGEGTQYSQFFRPFDISGYNQAQQSLKELEQNLLSNVGQRFSQATTQLQSQVGVTMEEITGQAARSGLVSGATQRRRELAYETGQEKFEEQKRQTQSQYTSVQEQIGTRAGQLEGTLFDFLGGAASTALQLEGMDPTGGARIGTEDDVQRFLSQMSGLNSNDMQGMLSQLRSLIGQPYQIMLDLFKDYQNQQGGGMNG